MHLSTDFLSQVESVLHVLDVVVLVIAAREGVQPQTRLFFSWEADFNTKIWFPMVILRSLFRMRLWMG